MSVSEKSSADVARERGWKVGDVLAGAAIRDSFGTVLEGPVRVKITAIGWEQVLAVRQTGGVWRGESSWTFDARDWSCE